MTNQRRATTRAARRSPARRTGRLVWVNTILDGSGMTENGIDIFSLLGSAADFMLFDTTIVAIYIPYMDMTFTLGGATGGLRGCGVALMVANENLDAADIIDGPRASNIGPPWMWHSANITRFAAAAGEATLPLIDARFPQVRSKRRFRENNQELFLITQNLVIGADDSNVQISAYFRILIRIP